MQQRKTDQKLAPTVMRWSGDRSSDAVGRCFVSEVQQCETDRKLTFAVKR